jgi:hypothetical protein
MEMGCTCASTRKGPIESNVLQLNPQGSRARGRPRRTYNRWEGMSNKGQKHPMKLNNWRRTELDGWILLMPYGPGRNRDNEWMMTMMCHTMRSSGSYQKIVRVDLWRSRCTCEDNPNGGFSELLHCCRWLGLKVVVRPHLSSKRRPHFKRRRSLGTNKNLVMSPDATRNQELLCWRGPAANYCTARWIIPINAPFKPISDRFS